MLILHSECLMIKLLLLMVAAAMLVEPPVVVVRQTNLLLLPVTSVLAASKCEQGLLLGCSGSALLLLIAVYAVGNQHCALT
ncbi:hypothetical protein L6452_30644 [Arctium lappa]|uniref:Uncharacterized protein n=1 Tax=Arctium lappa TaxID=4217 RepID=A0ACB8ZIJ2_ARCLA|nr:hypothetical protein L6452_30644 [Arctium lappa]